MKGLAIFLIVCGSTYCVQAQQTFENVYVAGTSFMFNLTELNSGNVLVGLGWARGVSRLDPLGNVIQTHSYWSDTLTSIGGIRRMTDNEFVFAAGYRKDFCGPIGSVLDRYPVLGKMDSLGNVQQMHHYKLNLGCSNVSADVIGTNDGGVITWGYDHDFFMLKVDEDLMPVWAKTFGNNGGIRFMKELPGGDLLAGINMDTAGAVVARLDPNGNFLWCKSYLRPRGMMHDAVIESDDSFIITGYTDSITNYNLIPLPPSDYDPKLFMMKLDGSGDVQWCRSYESDPYPWYIDRWSRIERTGDGNYAVLATVGLEDVNIFHRPFLMKTDPNGDTLWTRSFDGSNNYIFETFDLLVHSDGGFVISGDMLGNIPGGPSGGPFIFKTDSMGHFSCYDRSYPVAITDLFPVDSSFTLNSVDGATMMPAFLTDTILAPITVYDACMDIYLDVPRTTRSPQRMSLRPNPTTGQFTVEFADPLMAESYYSVYDTMGKLLYQRPLATGKRAEQIDLTRYGAGTYVLKFTDRDGVCYERVVVE